MPSQTNAQQARPKGMLHLLKPHNSTLMLKAQKVPFGREQWGNVVKSTRWDNGTPEYGFYSFGASGSIDINELFTDDNMYANASGAMVGNRLNVIRYNREQNVMYHYLYNATTDACEDVSYLTDFSMWATETAVSADNKVYGVFFTGDAEGTELGIADYANETRTAIGTVSRYYVALGITKDNVLYGIDTDGNLYSINSTTAKDTKIGDFMHNEQVAMLTIPKETVKDAAPAIASDMSLVFDKASLTGKVCFTAPSTTYIGSCLSGSFNYVVSVDGKQVKNGTANAGQKVEEALTVKRGIHSVAVCFSNAAGNGPKAYVNSFIGDDIPLKPTNVKATVDIKTGKVNLSWTAVTKGINGGYVGDMKYNVVRYPDNKAIDGTKLTSDMEVKIVRDGEVIQEMGVIEPGQKYYYLDNYAQNGYNYYSVIASNDEGIGRESKVVEAYVGEDTPAKVQNIKYSVDNDVITLTWDPVTTGQHGGYRVARSLHSALCRASLLMATVAAPVMYRLLPRMLRCSVRVRFRSRAPQTRRSCSPRSLHWLTPMARWWFTYASPTSLRSSSALSTTASSTILPRIGAQRL